MPAYLCIALGNATRQALQDNAQGVFVKAIVAANPAAAVDQFAQEQGQPGRYAACPAASLTSSVVARTVTLDSTPDP